MKIIKSEVGILNKTKKLAHVLGSKALIVSKPEKARFFLRNLKGSIIQTKSTYKKLIKQVKLYNHLTHEVENLFDNYYIVDNAISEVLNTTIDKGFKKLVQIEKKPNIFIPRIYLILSELLKASEYKIDRDVLYSFLEAYQTKANLSIRELSFVPYFLRIIFVENVENLMHKSILSLDEFNDAEYWFDQIVKKREKDKGHDYSKITSDMALKYGVIPVNLGYNLLQKLSQYGPDTRPIVKWIKLNLLKQGINISDLAEIENKRQNDISNQISNIINSLRWINQARWDNFVVDINTVDSFLEKDPAGVYKKLDQASQTAYRNEVVKISDRAGIHESEVAKLALRLCHQAVVSKAIPNNITDHVGYYLIGGGRNEFEKKIGYRKPLSEKIRSFVLAKSSFFYFSSILIINTILTAIFVYLFPNISNYGFSFIILATIAFILNADITLNLINIFISSFIPVRALFRLDLSEGVSPKQATFVVMPSMFRDEKSARELLRRLEVNYLGNSSENVFFALLMDFRDSKMESSLSDLALVEQINKGLKELNNKYSGRREKFYLFHRRNIWNPQENVFMGWERKRGKLREFNLLLRNIKQTSYFEHLPKDLPHIKYVLTIDEDTRLPKDSVIKLIGCIDHPLNQPVLDLAKNKVVSGYGIIQPRMTTRFSLARATVFSRLFSSSIGVDSYSGPGADVYQDLFNNSIFFGKGIYDVDVMELTSWDRIPENQVLSHDLLEGLYTRVGFATDIFLFEGFPESYKEYILRMNRWIRGDWQIISWLKFNKQKNNSFSFNDKWKIFDNLRRSTVPVFLIVFLLISYLFFTDQYVFSFLYSLLVVGSSFVISYILRAFEWPKEMTLLMKLDRIFVGLIESVRQIIYRFIFIFDQAIVSLQAVTTSWYRLNISKKYLLRWQNSYEVATGLKGTLREVLYIMMPAQIISLVALFLLFYIHNNFYSYLTLTLWFVSPFVAYQISRKENKYKYKNQERKLLRGVACRSARYFLELSRRDGNYLIPDHYQEEPATNSPAATSPTNIGMHLLAHLSAYDLGYISFSNFLERTVKSFENLDRLERYRGHFYNWYDIRTLFPLNPKYVSSVDSANLLLNLLTLKQGILDITGKPLLSMESMLGLTDVLTTIIEDSNLIIKDKTVLKSDRRLAQSVLNEARMVLEKNLSFSKVESIEQVARVFAVLAEANEKIKKTVSTLNLGLNKGTLSNIYSSVDHFNSLLRQQSEELDLFMSFSQIRKTKPVIHSTKGNLSLARALHRVFLKLNFVPSLDSLGGAFKQEIEDLNILSLLHSSQLNTGEKENIEHWYYQVISSLNSIQSKALKSKNDCQNIILLIDKFFEKTDFAFLYNQERGLFHLGYNVTFEKIDNSYYDFLASEANAISFLAILKNDVPLKHWSYLGRKLVQLDMRNVSLSSWGGSLFEYLTSLIFLKVHPESLLGHTAKVAIENHIKYGKKYRVPWGMGESAFSALDLNSNYQYQIFGHPSLGLKRDLKDYLVVAPYTTIMSLAFKPREAMANLKRIIAAKFIGRYGFYDAIDYTAEMEEGLFSKKGSPVKIYYAHHQGFSLQALNNQINQDRIFSLFYADPRVESLDTILEEKIPSSIPAKPIKSFARLQTEYLAVGTNDNEIKQFVPLYTSYPRRAFLSNGSYTVDISNTGSGGSKSSDICLTRFREDTVAEPWGQFVYLFDVAKKVIWSPTTQPAGISLGKNKIEYFENKARFNKIHDEIESSLTVAIAPDSDVEFRVLTLTNNGKNKKNIKVASYGEVALARANEDLHHMAFEKLFTKSEYWQKYNALIFTKPNKTERDANLFLAHKILCSLPDKSEPCFTTDRGQFVSRGGSLREPDIFSRSLKEVKPNLGYNFDQIFSFQNEIELKQAETVTITYVNIFSKTKEELVKNLKRYSNQKEVEHAIKKSDKQGHDVINNIGMSREQALHYQALASRLLSPHYSQETKKYNSKSDEPAIQSLWRLGLSGDLPILIVRFYDMNDLALVKNTLLCHKYLKYKGIAHDLVLLNEYPSSYIKSFEDEVDFLIRYNQSVANKTIRGGVHHVRASHVSEYDKDNLLFLAKITLDSKQGTIEQQISSILQSGSKIFSPYLKAIKKAQLSTKDTPFDFEKLKFFNGYGGFDTTNKEYVIDVNHDKGLSTPAPWVNVIANKEIGSVITESGSTYTWFIDSYDNRLTRRIDDPLLDKSSEIFYLRDEETGEFWNPTPLPIKNPHTYKAIHGLGYTKFEHESHGLYQSMTTYVPVDDSIKITIFKFANKGKTLKKLSLTNFFEMSLGGANREDNKDYLKTIKDKETGALLIKNFYGESFKRAWAFVDLHAGKCLITNDREEFLGKNGIISKPAAMYREKLSNHLYDDVDHCVAEQTFFEIEPGQEMEIIALFGGSNSIEEAQKLVKKYRNFSHCESSVLEVKSKWKHNLEKVQISTPDESLNILFNERLLHQVISSRLLARTGYYQPSGAYGFRDQLQDSMALVWSNPQMTKEIILKASQHQFIEGDVQNWWHEHNSFGVRTAFSDQQLWLAYVVSFYLEATGDAKILHEKEAYLKGPLLDFITNSNWAGVPEVLPEKHDLYDHCLRAIERTFVFGKNGLPIIGKGDWNDGFNKVGERGLGESVWLGWFLYAVINKFIPYIEKRGDSERVKRYELTAKNLKKALEDKAWDGKWYKRAFFDNGTPLGSHSNKEFKIDSISQSWSVLSGAGRADRSKLAMNSVMKYLFQDNNLLLLISPALSNFQIDPGYIRDYPPGVRENGAQYNHGALWAAQAFAELKDPVSMMKIVDSVNPIKRSADKEKASLYRVEPYVVASDIYAKPVEAGRGGWTWYTGSAGVMYRLIFENILGIKIKANKMEINPCIPKDWTDFSVKYHFKGTKYNIHVINNTASSNIGTNKKIAVDGIALSGHTINLIDDDAVHEVEVRL